MTTRYITINTKIDNEKRLVHPLIYDLLYKETHNNIQIIFYITDSKYDFFETNSKENNEKKIEEYRYSVIDLRQTKYQPFLLNGTFKKCKCGFFCKEEIEKEVEDEKNTDKCINKALNKKTERKVERNIFNNKIYESHNDCLAEDLKDFDKNSYSMDFLYKKLFDGNSKKLFILVENQFRFLVHHGFFNFDLQIFEKTQYIFEMEHLTTGNFVYLQEFLQPKNIFFKEEKDLNSSSKSFNSSNGTKKVKISKNIKQPVFIFVNNEKVLDYTNFLSLLKIKVVDKFLISEIFEEIFFNEKLKVQKLSLYSTYEEKENNSKDIFKKNEYNFIKDLNEMYSLVDEEKVKEYLPLNFDKKFVLEKNIKNLKERSLLYFLKALTGEEPETSFIKIFEEIVVEKNIPINFKEENKFKNENINFYINIYKKWSHQFNSLLSFLETKESKKIFYIRISDKVKYNYFLDILNYLKTTKTLPFLNKIKTSIIHHTENEKERNVLHKFTNCFIKIVELDSNNGSTQITNLMTKDFYEKFRGLKITEKSNNSNSFNPNFNNPNFYNQKYSKIQDIFSLYSQNILINVTQLIRQIYLSNYFMISTVFFNFDIQKKVEKKVLFNLEDEEFFNNIKKVANSHKQTTSIEDFSLNEIRIPNFLPSNLIRQVFTKILSYQKNQKNKIQSKKEYRNEVCKILLEELISHKILQRNFLVDSTSLLKNNDLYLKNLLTVFISECVFFKFLKEDKSNLENYNEREFYDSLKNKVYNKNKVKKSNEFSEITLRKFSEIIREREDSFIKNYLNTFINKLVDIPVLRNNTEILNMRSLDLLKNLLKELLLFTYKRYKHLTKLRPFTVSEIENLIYTSKKALLTKISQINVLSDNQQIKENTITPRICICYHKKMHSEKDSNNKNIIEFNQNECIFKIHFSESLFEFLFNFSKTVFKENGFDLFRRKYTYLAEDFTENEFRFKKADIKKEINNNKVNIFNNTDYEIDLFYIHSDLNTNCNDDISDKNICNDDISDINRGDKLIIENKYKKELKGHRHLVLYGILKNPYQNPESDNFKHIGCIKISGKELIDLVTYNKFYFNNLFDYKKNNYGSQFIMIPYLCYFTKKEMILYREIVNINNGNISEIFERTKEIIYDPNTNKIEEEKNSQNSNNNDSEKSDEDISEKSNNKNVIYLKSKKSHTSSIISYIKYFYQINTDKETIKNIKKQRNPLEFIKNKYLILFDSEIQLPYLYDTILNDFCLPLKMKDKLYKLPKIINTNIDNIDISENEKVYKDSYITLQNILKTFIYYKQYFYEENNVLKYDLDKTIENIKEKYENIKEKYENIKKKEKKKEIDISEYFNSEEDILYTTHVKGDIPFRFLNYCIPIHLNYKENLNEEIKKFMFGINFSDFSSNIFGVDSEALLNSSVLEIINQKSLESSNLMNSSLNSNNSSNTIKSRKKKKRLNFSTKNTKTNKIDKNIKNQQIKESKNQEIKENLNLIIKEKKICLYNLLNQAFFLQTEDSKYHQLEFLGDTVLKYLTTEYLVKTFLISINDFKNKEIKQNEYLENLKSKGFNIAEKLLDKEALRQQPFKFLNPLEILSAAKSHAVNNNFLSVLSKKAGLSKYINNENNYNLNKFNEFHVKDLSYYLNLNKRNKNNSININNNSNSNKEIKSFADTISLLSLEINNYLSNKYIKNEEMGKNNKIVEKIIGMKPHADLMEALLGVCFLFDKKEFKFPDRILRKLNVLNENKLENLKESLFEWFVVEMENSINCHSNNSNMSKKEEDIFTKKESLKYHNPANSKRHSEVLKKFKITKNITNKNNEKNTENNKKGIIKKIEEKEYQNILNEIYRYEKIINLKEIKEVENILNYKFKNKGFLEKALIHGSSEEIRNMKQFYVFEKTSAYELLEFVGDSFLDMAVLEMLFNKNSKEKIEREDMTRFDLHKFKSTRVDNVSFSKLLVELGLHKFIKSSLSPLEIERETEKTISEMNGDECVTKMSLKKFGDMFESLIGAVFIDSDFQYEQTKNDLKKVLEQIFTN